MDVTTQRGKPTTDQRCRAELMAAVDELVVAVRALTWVVESAKVQACLKQEAADSDLETEEHMFRRTRKTSKSKQISGDSATTDQTLESLITSGTSNETEQRLAIENAFADRFLISEAPALGEEKYNRVGENEVDETEVPTAPSKETVVNSALSNEEIDRVAIEDAFAERILRVHGPR